jgi:hypothetical protein
MRKNHSGFVECASLLAQYKEKTSIEGTLLMLDDMTPHVAESGTTVWGQIRGEE